ncbi:hypothetical protein QBC36DRAFT_102680 [Triangularia setosa]|uniref:Uncharacterized protein n=1 Tax=Triangularia setosa TaxID=2587417 RepID=A0AAN7A3M6_9PEZI|nr:hypothetical protein QBC36DRAFT_102680 [Podospora setosa]
MDQTCPPDSSSCGNNFCCPDSLPLCDLSGQRCLPRGGSNVTDNHDGPCPGFDGYIACRQQIGGNVSLAPSSLRAADTKHSPGGCCPPNFACLEDNCHLTLRLEAQPQLETSTIFTSTNGTTHVWMVTTFAASITTTVSRITTASTFTGVSPSVESVSPENPSTLKTGDIGLSTGPLIGVIVAAVIIAFSLIALGVYFVVRCHRQSHGTDKPAENSTDPQSTLELAKDAHPHEMDAEMQTKRELEANDVACELEDTQYCPELMGTHRGSEVEQGQAKRSDDDGTAGSKGI